MFFGLILKTSYSYYPDVLIISDSDYVRDMYKLKLNDMTINKINYNIERWIVFQKNKRINYLWEVI